MAVKNNIEILNLINNSGCFDLQFRKDTRHERLNSPTYYRWKVQFVITAPKEKIKSLKKIKNIIGCGKISITKPARIATRSVAGGGQARFSVQKIDDITDFVLPFFKKNTSTNKRNFELWQRAVNIIYDNKGKNIIKWKKNDLFSLIQIHKSIAQYKKKPRKAKWMERARLMTKTL